LIKYKKIKKLNFYNFSRDYLYIDDLMAAIIKSTKYKKKNFEIFNIGSGKSISAKDLANMIARIIKKKIEFNELKN
jgi:nucleoside-diphosphate-sugar epimerase